MRKLCMLGLVFATGVALAGDEKEKKPAEPVDVPGFWTTDELRRIDEGLAILNCTRKDLGFQKRPIDDPFRLPVVNQILDDPLSIGPVAAEWDHVARACFYEDGESCLLLSQAVQSLNPGTIASPRNAFGESDLADANALADRLPEKCRLGFLYLVHQLCETDAELESLFDSLPPDDRRPFLRKALLSQVEHPAANPKERDLDDATFIALAQKFDRMKILYHVCQLNCAVADLAHQLRDAPPGSFESWRDTVRVKTPRGAIVISGVADDYHDEGDDVMLVIDLGGNDTYTHGASANWFKKRYVSVVVDVAGDDRYVGRNDFSFGGALGGVAIQRDGGGDDVYLGGNCSCGAGICGFGSLTDEGGDDVYRVKDFGEGAGAFGIGLLLDKGGNDTYHADMYGQGFGSTWGCGMLVDLAGNDVYDAGGVHVHAPLWRDRYESLSQGFAIGMRPDASGGVGVLVDVSGNDRYSCDIFGQGASYWYSLGLLIDDDGHDTYCCGQYGQGAGIHLSCGMLLDRHGQDCYYDANGVGIGGAHDYSVGFLVDREGDDYYCGGGGAQGGALTNSVAMLLDDAGDDSYAATRDGTQGSATPARDTGGIGMLLDGGGHDRFTETMRAGGIAVKDIVGACVDELTPPDAPHADPMNAAIDGWDAQKKVEAEGMTDGKWDLDKLWKLVTAWEVGDNTVVMPIARKQFVALGTPALDRAFEHFDAKDSLLTRAIEKTLEAFPRDEWIPRLLEKTKDASKLVRKNALLMVTNLKVSEALPRLTEMLANDSDTQGGVLAALAALKTAPPQVAALLKAPKESVGVQAAVCLGAVGDDDAVKSLIAALGEDYAFPVRLAAEERLAALGDAVVARLDMLLGNVYAETPKMQRRNALRALGRSKSARAAGSIANDLTSSNGFVRLSAMLAADELLQSIPPASDHGLADALAKARAAETDPLVKRLVVAPARK